MGLGDCCNYRTKRAEVRNGVKRKDCRDKATGQQHRKDAANNTHPGGHLKLAAKPQCTPPRACGVGLDELLGLSWLRAPVGPIRIYSRLGKPLLKSLKHFRHATLACLHQG